jgi:hypothetical protein
MRRKDDITSTIVVDSPTGDIKLTTLLLDEGCQIWENTLWLEISNYSNKNIAPISWDSKDWLEDLYKHLKKRKKTKVTKEFKSDCKEAGIDFEQSSIDYVACYRRMKKIIKTLDAEAGRQD